MAVGLSAREAFRTLVNAHVATGLSPQAAVSKVARENPSLHQQTLAEANPGKPEPEHGAPTGPGAIAEWNRRLEAMLDRGTDRADAVCRLAREAPSLHTAYIDAVNDGRPKRRGRR